MCVKKQTNENLQDKNLNAGCTYNVGGSEETLQDKEVRKNSKT